MSEAVGEAKERWARLTTDCDSPQTRPVYNWPTGCSEDGRVCGELSPSDK